MSNTFPLTIYDVVGRRCEASQRRIVDEAPYATRYLLEATCARSAWAYAKARGEEMGHPEDPASCIIVARHFTGRVDGRGLPVYVADWSMSVDPLDVEALERRLRGGR